MIIEFTGCTGSGKTSLSAKVIDKLIKYNFKIASIHPERIIECPFIDPRFADVSVHNIITDIKILPWLFLAIKRHFRFFLFMFRMLIKYSDSINIGLIIFRSFIRKFGIYRLCSQKKIKNWIIIVDEGIIHTAHNVLAQVNKKALISDIKKFSDIVPIPDILVAINVPEKILMERTRTRGDKSPRIRSENDIHNFILNTIEVFEEILVSERLKSNVFQVEFDNEQSPEAVKQIVKHILKTRNIANTNGIKM